MVEHIVAKDLAGLRLKLLDVIKKNKYFQCDVCTGNFKVTCGETDIVCTPDKAFDYFTIYFGDKCLIQSTYTGTDGQTKQKTSGVSRENLKALFHTIGETVQYNSRLEKYDAIPKWDGIPRIDSFLKIVFNCRANPNFFRLFLTAIIGKMADPANAYVPYFFDFVGKKGVGKTLLHSMLVGEDYVVQVEPTSRSEEVLTQIYTHNAIIAIDDEGNLTASDDRGAWSEDKLKSFVTRTEDVFSRKFLQPERRVRSFILVRTSNEIKSSTDPDERRQIIFESKLPPNVCRLFDYGKKNFEQLMAEAKDYYEKNGVYQLTPQDRADITRQQAMYFNDETSYYVVVRKYIRAMVAAAKFRPETLKLGKFEGYFITQWIDFEDYRINELHSGTSISGRLFWKIMRGLEAKGEPIRIRDGEIGNSHIMFAQILHDKEPDI